LPDARDKLLKRCGLHVNSSLTIRPSSRACAGVRSAWSFFAYA
jgi:hypothetical protein